MTAPSGVDAVVFDWGGTLTPWHDVDVLGTWRAVAELYDAERADEVAGLLHEAEVELWERARTSHESGRIAEIFAAAGVAATEEMLDAYHGVWEPHTFIDPDAPGLLAALRDRGVRVGVLSNTHWSRETHERVFARDGVLDLIDGAVYTSEIPWTKPHPGAFRAAMSAVGVDDPARVVFVGDRPVDDISGARAAGMRAVLVPHSEVPAHDVEPDAVVRRLSDLLPLVDAWRR